MSFSHLIRRRVPLVTIFCRHGSSTATNHKPQRVLPDEKLRALVSLYHQADTFITLENLSQRIDDAFLTPTSGQLTGFRHQSSTVPNLKQKLRTQREQARVTEWDRETAYDYAPGDRTNYRWTGISKGREHKVKEALYGLSHEGNLPGIEVLRDAVANGRNIPKSDIRDLVEERDEGNLPGIEVSMDVATNGQNIPASDVQDLPKEKEH